MESPTNATSSPLTTYLTAAGFTTESAIAAVTTGDLKRLRHTGVISIRLRPPGAQDDGDGLAGVPARI